MRSVSPLTLDHLVLRLRPYAPAPGARRQAAVAAILRPGEAGLEVLLMQRAAHPRDPWSGDACLPGGHWTPGDASLLATALRETREEVGLELEGARLLGSLAPIRPFGPLGRLFVQPFVFALDGEARLTLGAEAVDVFWLPLDAAASGALDGRLRRRVGPLPLGFACWRQGDRVVWGLTLRMLRGLLPPRAGMRRLP